MISDNVYNISRYSSSIFGMLNGFKSFLKANRLPLGVCAAIVFLAGSIWSIRSLDIAVGDLVWFPLLIIFAVMAPLMLVYGGIGLSILARTLDVKIGFFASIRLAAAAQMAEALPLPGGAMIRTAALVNAGGQVKKSAILVTATAILWISLAAGLAGTLLMLGNGSHGQWMLAGGLLGAIPVLVWIVNQAGVSLAVLVLLHRSIGLALMIIRLTLAFAAVQVAVSPDAAALFTFASIAGSAASIAPAGLGVSETIAAFSASLVTVLPAAAFLAVALNRITGLIAVGIISLITEFSVGRKDVSNDE